MSISIKYLQVILFMLSGLMVSSIASASSAQVNDSALTPVSTSAAPHSRTWNVSGQELLDAIQGKTDVKAMVRDSLQQQIFADAYLFALIDSQDWCFTGKVLPHEMKSHVFEYLHGLAPSRLADNAASLSHEALTLYCSQQK